MLFYSKNIIKKQNEYNKEQQIKKNNNNRS